MNFSKTLNKNQFGFRIDRSNIEALLNIVSYIVKNINMGRAVRDLFFNSKKEFETLDLFILFIKSYRYRIRVVIYEWFKSYFQG